MPDISGLKPAILKDSSSLFRHVPIAFEDRWSSNQQLAVIGDLHLHIRHWLANATQAVMDRIIHGNDGGSLGQSIAFVNAKTNIGEPRRDLFAERSAT